MRLTTRSVLIVRATTVAVRTAAVGLSRDVALALPLEPATAMSFGRALPTIAIGLVAPAGRIAR